jgi:hypothetical protein
LEVKMLLQDISDYLVHQLAVLLATALLCAVGRSHRSPGEGL